MSLISFLSTAGLIPEGITPVSKIEPLPIDVRGTTVLVSVEVTRSADGGATYAANQVVGPGTGADATLVGCARVNGGTGKILRARLIKNSVTIANANFRSNLFNTAVTAINDKAANTLLYANASSRDGTIDFTSFITSGTGSDAAVANGQFQQGYASFLPFKCAANSKDLLVRHEALAAYVAAASEKFTLQLLIEQD